MADRYDERESDFYRKPRRDRDYDDFEVDIQRERYPEPRRAETVLKERDTVVSDRRTERGPRLPDFLREDYGAKSNAGPLVVREDKEEDVYSRAPTRRRSLETVRSRAPTERVEKDKFVFKEEERGPPYPRSRGSEVGYRGRPVEEDDREVIYRSRTRSRPPPREESEKEEIDINIRREESRPPPPRSPPPVEEIRFRRGGGDRPPPRKEVDKTEIDIDIHEHSSPPPPSRARSVVDRGPPPPRTEVDKEEFTFRERRRSPSRHGRGREVVKEEIDIRETSHSRPPPRPASRGNLIARKEEEWVVRRPRTPPPKDWEKEEIIIRRKERTPSPEPPPKAPSPESSPSPPPPPPPEPIYRPPIIQEVITHHRHIDHGVERARSPTPPPPAPPSPPPPPKETHEDNLEIEIKRKGTRNGKAYEEDITFERDTKEREEPSRELERYEDRRREVSRRRSPSRRRYDDEIAAEADYYNRKIASRSYPGEAYNGATRDWGLVDVPPGTERVRMDGVGGGAQEITWERYNGQRRGKFISGDRAYEPEYGNGYHSPPPLPPPPPAPPAREEREEIKITHTRSRSRDDRPRHRKRDKMWTEVTKDLVIKEAIDEMGYEFEETDDYFYVMEYLRYVSCYLPGGLTSTNNSTGGCAQAG